MDPSIRKSPESPQKFIRKVLKMSSESPQKVIRKSSLSPQKVLRKSFESSKKLIRKSSESPPLSNTHNPSSIILYQSFDWLPTSRGKLDEQDIPNLILWLHLHCQTDVQSILASTLTESSLQGCHNNVQNKAMFLNFAARGRCEFVQLLVSLDYRKSFICK